MYSWAVWAANTQSATTPKRPAVLVKLNEIPVGSESTSLLILTPRSPFPSGESTNRNKTDVIKLVTKVTAKSVDTERDGRRSFVNSALNTFHIITHPSFQRRSLPEMPSQELMTLK